MIKIKLDGFAKAVADIDKLADQINKEVHVALVDFGTKVEAQAKRDAPADEGKLRNSINSTVKGLTASITVTANYAAYLEFGTRKFAAKYVATLPQDWKTLAATFKGKGGGDYFDFLNAILDWVIRKGIANRYSVKTQKALPLGKNDQQRLEETAYAIALSILRNGIKPQPFLKPAVDDHTPALINDFKKIFK